MHPSRAGRQRRACRVLVAAAGYGKSTALRRWYPAAASRWHRGGELDPHHAAAQLLRLVAGAAGDGVGQLVVDDLPTLPAEAVDALVSSIDGLPETVTVVLASRWPLAAPATRWLGRGMWTELGPADLALTPDEVAELIRAEYALPDPDLAERVHEATGGWPALVHLSAETLRTHGVPHGPLASAVAAPGSLVAGYLADEVLSALPAQVNRLLRTVGDLAPVSAELCRVLGHRRAAETVRMLTRTGLLTPAGSTALPGAPVAGQHIVPVVAEVVRRAQRHPAAKRRTRTAATAAAWYDEHGPAVAAARAYRQAGDDDGCARVLEEHGRATLLAGHVDAISALIRELPEELHSRRLRLLLGDALRIRGDVDAAMRAYDAVAGAGPDCDAGLAWRRGRVHYQRGNARAALDAFAAATATQTGGADVALLLAYTADAHLLAGNTETATAWARRAVATALDAGDDPALATAYVSLALCHGAAGGLADSEERYAMALPVAERTGDVHLLSRICTNQTFHLLCAARYADALAAARRSALYAAAAGSAALRAIATCNEGDALTLLGRYDEAVTHYAAALSRYQRMGSRRVAAVHLGLGDVYRRRGWGEQARAAYEEAVRVAGAAGNAHVLVPALAGLALTMLDGDPGAAATHADRAEAAAGDDDIIGPALLAQGWVARQAGDRARAQALAGEAVRVARTQHNRAGLADALELRAGTETDRAGVRAALREAQAIWAAAGATVEAARILVALAHLPEAGTDDRLNGLLAAEHLATAGALAHRPGTLLHPPRPAEDDQPAGGAVVIRALGRFEVQLGGRTVAASSWQSRKARDLLRILVARRGRPVPRGELCELLWPDDDPDRTGHRLSVLLSIVRGVLDPARACATDHYLVADQASIALDIARVRVDVEEFLAHVAHARRLVDRGAFAEVHTLLVAVEGQYRADAFEDEPYAEWSGPMREQARAAYLAVLRMLAQVSRATAGPAAAVGYLLRLLERDPYDESAHRALVRTLVAGGQHGEARRAFARYGEAMRAIGVRPPDEVVLAPAR